MNEGFVLFGTLFVLIGLSFLFAWKGRHTRIRQKAETPVQNPWSEKLSEVDGVTLHRVSEFHTARLEEDARGRRGDFFTKPQ
jgi:hypothetical protein